MGHCEPPWRACGAAWHLRSVSAPAGESRQFALPISPSSVAVFRRNSFRLAFVRRSARVASKDRSRWLADPLRLSAEGAPPDGETSGALCRGVALTRRLQTSSRSPAVAPPFSATTTATTPGPELPTPVRTPSLRCPEHLRSDRDTTLRSRETRSRSLDGHAPRLAPFSPTRSSPPCQGWGRPSGLLPARSVRLAAPLALAEKMLLTDFCNRPFDTSTRGTFDFRARSKLRRPPPRDLPDRSPAGRASCGVEPPCGDPTPDGRALDGAQPASASSPAASPKGSRAPLESGTSVAAGLSPACEVGESTSDTPCRHPRDGPETGRRREPEPVLPSTRQNGRFSRLGVPSIEKCSREPT